MPHLITSALDLYRFLLARMRQTGPAVTYPAPFVSYVDQFINGLSHLQNGADRLYSQPAGEHCPHCGTDVGVAVLASLTSPPEVGRLGTRNRLFAALAIDLLAKLPLGLSLGEVNAAMISLLDLDLDGSMRIAGAGDTLRWKTTRAGEAALGTSLWVQHSAA